MYKKIIIIALLFVFCSSVVHAQKFEGGFLGGLSTSQIDGDTQSGYAKLGFFAGVFVETMFTNVIGVKAELYYIGKGAKLNAGSVEVFKTHTNYIEIPFLVSIKPLNHVELDLGFAFAYLISARMFELDEEVPQKAVEIHSFDVSAMASGSYFFNDNWALNVRFDYSIVPSKNNPNWFNNNLSFGFLYRFN
jgi:hypothetical protein